MGIVLSLIKGEGCDCISEKQEIRETDPKYLIPNDKRIEIEKMGNKLRVSKIEAVKELYELSRFNFELLMKIYEENEQIVDKLKAKIDELSLKQSSKIVEIGTGNSCNNPCYQYNLELTKVCPKCGGKVESDYENDYEIINKYDDYRKCFRDIKDYNQKKICTGFRFNNNIGKEDVDLNAFFDYFEKVDNEKKCYYYIFLGYKAGTKAYELPYRYMMIDGERFYFPYGIGMKEFFLMNEYEFFPRVSKIPYEYSVCFFYERDGSLEDLG